MSRKENRCRYSKISEITGLAAEGNALGRHGDMVVFVPFGAPGDIADVKLRKKKKSYAQGRIVALKQEAATVCSLLCEHFTICGAAGGSICLTGCSSRQSTVVADAIDRIAKVEHPCNT